MTEAAALADPDALAGAPGQGQPGGNPQPVTDPDVLTRFSQSPKPVSDPGVLSRFKASAEGRTPAPASFVESVMDIPQEALAAGKGALKSGIADIMSAFHHDGAPPDEGFWKGYVSAIGDHLSGAGRFAKGLAELAGSPIAAVTGGASAPGGYALAQLEHGIGTVINPERAAQDDPQAMYETARGDMAQALGLAMPRSGMRAPAPGPTPRPTLPPEAVANQVAADEFGVKLSRGQAASELDDIRYEDMAARGAYGKPAQEVAAPFFEQQFQGIQGAGRDIGEQVGRGAPVAASPGEAASTVNAEIGASAEQARRATAAAEAQAAREAEAARTGVQAQGQALTESIRDSRPAIDSPRDAGEIVGQQVRGQATADRQAYQDRYNEAFSLPGQFRAGAFEGIGNRIQGALTLGEDPVIIDDVTTPVASRAIKDLDNISNLRFQNRADPFGRDAMPGQFDPVTVEKPTVVDLRGVDQARKRLVAHYRGARGSNNPSDARATGRLIDAFDNQVENAISEGLFTGDPRALQAIQEARGAYSRYARAYRPQQAGDDVGSAMRRIIDRQATPEEIANMVIGSGRLGNAGLPVRLADRLEAVLGRNSDAWSAIRQGIWQRASQIRTTAGEIDPARSAQNVFEFANSSLGRRMFSAQELAAMRTHAQGVRDLDRMIEAAPATQAAQRARTAYQDTFGGEGIGGAQQATFRRIVEGAATPEETAQAVFNAIGGGNPGNVTRMLSAIERIAGASSDTMAAIRQGVWQKLTQNAAGKDAPGQQKLAQSIAEFISGKGRSIAQQLYTPDELALMQRYARAVKLTVIPKYARTNSDTAPAFFNMVNKYASAVSTALGATIEAATGGLAHGVLGAATGYGVGKMIEKGVAAATEVGSARKVSKQFDWLNNPQPAKAPLGGRIRGALGATAAGSNTADEMRRLGTMNQPFLKLPAPTRTDDGDRSRPVKVETPEDVHHGAERTEVPSPAQAEAGNYKKRHVAWKGLDISIETEAGQDRVGMGRDGKPWSVSMPFPYGYVKNSKSADGEHLDVTMGPHPQAPRVFVVDQISPETGQHDEPKTFVGFRDQADAENAYHDSFSDGSGPDRMGAVTSLSVPEFKKWVADGDLKRPLAYDERAGRERARQSPAMMAQRPSLKDMLADDRSAREIKADLMRRGVLA